MVFGFSDPYQIGGGGAEAPVRSLLSVLIYLAILNSTKNK